ncbi:MAG TPA: ABC transporter permease [Patescibacteria group bacterium]|nr:ABC transporter permease [Patescibacteria group bacterium]
MNPKELLRLSVNSLRSNKLRTALTTLGIIIGVFAVILLVSIGTGLQSYITDKVSGLGSNLIFVIPGSVSGSRTAGGAVTNKLTLTEADILTQRLKNLAEVGPVIQKTSLVKFNSKSDKGTTVTGTTANFHTIIKISLTSGSFFTLSQERSGAKVAIIGPTVVDNLFNGQNPIGQKISVSGGKYTVIGVTEQRGSTLGIDQDNVVIIPIKAAQRQFGVTNVNAIYLSALKPELVSLVERRAKTTLLEKLTEDDFTLQTQEQTLSTISSITGVLTVALGGIAAISLLVGGIGVMNIMLVSVTERTKEIGLRKALGARRLDILKQFLLEAVMLSLAGGMIGILLGVAVSYILAKFFVSEVTLWSVLLAFFFSVVVGVVFGITPALRASKLSPIEALRYE